MVMKTQQLQSSDTILVVGQKENSSFNEVCGFLSVTGSGFLERERRRERQRERDRRRERDREREADCCCRLPQRYFWSSELCEM